MPKLTLNSLTSLVGIFTPLNANFDAIETEFDKVLYRDGTSPNEMNTNLDMNSYRIYNLPAANSPDQPVRKAEFDAAVFDSLGYTTASQAEAEAGTANGKVMTPLRTAQNVTARLATQAEAQTGTDSTKLMTPLRTTENVTARLSTQAEAEAGTDTTKLMTPQRTTQHLSALLGSTSFTATNRTRAIVLADREAQTVNILDFSGADNSGGSDQQATFTAALDRVNTDGGRRVLKLPGGVYRLDSSVVVALAANKPLTIKGDGIGVTRVVYNPTTNPIFNIGSPLFQSSQITFEDLEVIYNGTPTSDAVFQVTNSRDLLFKNVSLVGFKQAFLLGPGARANDAIRIHLSRVHLQPPGDMTGTAIEMRSGAILTIDNHCMFNGNGSMALMAQTSSSYNWDGFTMYGATCEQWTTALTVSGLGISNLNMDGNIFDRPTTNHISVYLPSGGTVKNWALTNNKFQGDLAANTITSIFLSNGSAAADSIFDVSIRGNSFFDIGNKVITSGGNCFYDFKDNWIRDCGFNGVQLVDVNEGDVVEVAGNCAHVKSRAGYIYGVVWNGASAPVERKEGTNRWLGFATGATLGTP